MCLLAVVLEMLQAVARLAESQRYSEGQPWCGGAGGRPGSARPAASPSPASLPGAVQISNIRHQRRIIYQMKFNYFNLIQIYLKCFALRCKATPAQQVFGVFEKVSVQLRELEPVRLPHCYLYISQFTGWLLVVHHTVAHQNSQEFSLDARRCTPVSDTSGGAAGPPGCWHDVTLGPAVPSAPSRHSATLLTRQPHISQNSP